MTTTTGRAVQVSEPGRMEVMERELTAELFLKYARLYLSA